MFAESTQTLILKHPSLYRAYSLPLALCCTFPAIFCTFRTYLKSNIPFFDNGQQQIEIRQAPKKAHISLNPSPIIPIRPLQLQILPGATSGKQRPHKKCVKTIGLLQEGRDQQQDLPRQ